jgi:hypothetical protein
MGVTVRRLWPLDCQAYQQGCSRRRKNAALSVLCLAPDTLNPYSRIMPVKLSSRTATACAIIVALAGSASCSQREAQASAAEPASRCLPGERGYLRASVRGAIDADIDWRGALLYCEGGARPDGSGLRVSFGGPPDAMGRRIRFVFGIAATPGGNADHDRPTNVTVIVEGRGQLYATQGEDKCTVESLSQQPLAAVESSGTSAGSHAYRIAARGYCIDPAATLQGNSHLYINRFDFAGSAQFEDRDLHALGTQS